MNLRLHTILVVHRALSAGLWGKLQIMRNEPLFQSVSAVSKRTGFSKAFLRREALAGHLPAIRAANRLLLNVPETEVVLARRSHGITEAANQTGAAPQGVLQ